jgi:hypothetical protein
VPISSLVPGEKVLATNVKTGKIQAEPVAAVLVHHDTDRYDLKIQAANRTAVIQTTSSHLFWDQTSGRWVKAAALKYGTRLRTPVGATAIVLGGYTPKTTTGWMWDLSVPGNNDHDFYIDVIDTAVLVHNCPINGYTRHGLNQAISRDGVGVSPSAILDAVKIPLI